MLKKKLIVAALLISSQAYSQQDTTSSSLNEVVITASKTELKQSQTGKIVTVIDQKTIANNIGRTLTELLNNQAGFYIGGANNVLGSNLDIYFRGAERGNMLIVIDGVPIYDPSDINNVFDLNSIPLDQIQRIEILKGGQSTIWGSDAVAGVIQIFLKKGVPGKTSINGLLSYGSYRTFRSSLGLKGTSKALQYDIQYGYAKSKGFSAAYDSLHTNTFDKDGFEQHNIQANLKYQISTSLSARLFGNIDTYANQLDEGAFTDDKDYGAKNRNNVGGIQLSYLTKPFNIHLLGSLQQSNHTYTNDSTDISSPYFSYSKGVYKGYTSHVEIFGNAIISKHASVVSGFQFLHQNTEQSYESLGSYPYKTALGSDSARTSQYAAYASLLLTQLNGFNLEMGGRFNHNSIYGQKGTFTFNPSFVIQNLSKVFLNISSAYKVPSLYQLFSEYGNKQLKPESSLTYELGIQSETKNHMIFGRVAAFIRDTRNLIIFYTDTITYNSFYINRNTQHDYGVEGEFKWNIVDHVSWTTNFTFVKGYGLQNGTKVQDLYHRPNFAFNSQLTITSLPGLTIIPAIHYVGSRLKGPYDPGPEKLPSYYTLDLFTAYQLKFTRLFVDFRNITDQLYFDLPGYNSKRFNLMAGLTFNL